MDVDALRALVAAYDAPTEGSREGVLDALRERGGGAGAVELATSADAAERRLAARLMHLLRDDRHPAALEPLVADPDPETAAIARRAFGAQTRTDGWEAIARRLATSQDDALRTAANGWLAGEP
jgi:hypothetical protein